MTSLVLQYPREEAKTIVKAAFENTRGIKQYHDDGHRIIGKTGMGIGSYGERIIAEIPEAQSGEEETMISVTAEKEVGMNVTANPEKYKSRFLEQLETFRGYEVEEVLEVMGESMSPADSKEVASADELRDGSSSMGMVMIAMILLFLFFNFVIFASI